MIVGHNGTRILVDAATKQQSSPSGSTAASEIKGINFAMKNWIIPAVEVIKRISPVPIESVKIFSDSAAAIQAIHQGYSIKLRYLSKTDGLSIAELSDLFKATKYELLHCPGKDMLADIGTKDVDPATFERLRTMLGILQI